jgi:hypothetical protein
LRMPPNALRKHYSVVVNVKTLLLAFTAGGATLSAQWSLSISRTSEPTKVVIDSPEIRRLVSDQEARQAEVDRFWREDHTSEEKNQRIRDMARHPDNFPAGRMEFLEAMANAPGLTVPGKTRAKVVEISKARCLPDAFSTISFIRVLVSGKKAPGGTEVWLCRNPYALPFEKP